MLRRDVIRFSYIKFHVIKLHGFLCPEPNCLPITHARRLREPAFMKLEVERWTLNALGFYQGWQDGNTVARHWQFLVGQFSKGWHQVPERPDLVAHHACFDPAGPARNARRTKTPF